MTIEVGIVFSLIACIIGVAGFIIGQKKSSKDDGLELGTFMGTIKTEISNIKDMVTELKNDTKSVDDKISKAIEEHLLMYHQKG